MKKNWFQEVRRLAALVLVGIACSALFLLSVPACCSGEPTGLVTFTGEGSTAAEAQKNAVENMVFAVSGGLMTAEEVIIDGEIQQSGVQAIANAMVLPNSFRLIDVTKRQRRGNDFAVTGPYFLARVEAKLDVHSKATELMDALRKAPTRVEGIGNLIALSIDRDQRIAEHLVKTLDDAYPKVISLEVSISDVQPLPSGGVSFEYTCTPKVDRHRYEQLFNAVRAIGEFGCDPSRHQAGRIAATHESISRLPSRFGYRGSSEEIELAGPVLLSGKVSNWDSRVASSTPHATVVLVAHPSARFVNSTKSQWLWFRLPVSLASRNTQSVAKIDFLSESGHILVSESIPLKNFLVGDQSRSGVPNDPTTIVIAPAVSSFDVKQRAPWDLELGFVRFRRRVVLSTAEELAKLDSIVARVETINTRRLTGETTNAHQLKGETTRHVVAGAAK